ncbi:hypothetical protein A0H81_04071 [Grifola frondosa]|uniref:Uncharacterized protein n=1 Tax=Grifola frondosa TaxID=5627 RepID=A0A1C7MJV1_GRIFR|nr:hypothetical protein A0H81_04071 [Grifola frondosa]
MTQQHTSSPSATTTAVQGEPIPLADALKGTNRRGLILWGVLLTGPLVLLPYIVVRKHLLSLHRKVAEIGTGNAGLRSELKSALAVAAKRRAEQDQVVALLKETKGALERLGKFTQQSDAARGQLSEGIRQDVKRGVELLQAQGKERDKARAQTEDVLRNDLKALLSEHRSTRDKIASTLKDLGVSLADVAAFMHEVEVSQGYTPRKDDGRGIERMRQLALRLQDLPVSQEDSNTPNSQPVSGKSRKTAK